MVTKNIIEAIIKKHKETGIEVNAPAASSYISAFERQIGFSLPPDFIEFYTTCNGFACNEDLFNMIPLADIMQHPQDYGTHCFIFPSI
jgi:hypothetical protein